MFSYRHAFHAGSHADVLKHSVFVHVLDYYNRKETPYWVIDTHAGAGIYDLRSEWAIKNGEFIDGLDKVLHGGDAPQFITDYLMAVQAWNPDGVANFYPGSPWLALSLMRENDRLRLFEMHPTEVQVLEQNLAALDQVHARKATVYTRDGFNGLKSQLPPGPRRAITIMDPSYEDKRDYRHVLAALEEGLKRFATGTYLIWYPMVQRREVETMVRSLEKTKLPWVHASLAVHKPASDGHGIHGSGMFVVNPPWTLHDQLKVAMPWLLKTLKQDNWARFTLEAGNL